jgi:hypothetical protein
MARSRFRLFYWLAIMGALIGYLLGEMILGTGNGLYVAPVSAIVGLLLAWALHRTRPANASTRAIEPTDERPATRPPERQRKTNTVRVAKSQGGKKR